MLADIANKNVGPGGIITDSGNVDDDTIFGDNNGNLDIEEETNKNLNTTETVESDR